ncbi:MAG: hypothetical protein JRJ85_15325 [Deltaproteobacteria bacterium]|nr:hypothetical protein [Deltaproteobacteria bacterium]
MSRLTGGEAIVKSLLMQGVNTIFGLPGVQNDFFYNALFDEQENIRVIHTRHEEGAAYMALGYALSSDKAGVYNVVPGPGLLNTTAALATAYACNAKVLCLTGQIESPFIGRQIGLLHEIPDQLGLIRSLTKWAMRISSPVQAPGLVAEAFRQMRSGRPRPVGLECAMDVLASRAEVDLTPITPEVYPPPVDMDSVGAAARLLGKAKFPMIFVGGGAMDAGEEVRQIAEALQAPVISSVNGRGILSSRHYLSHTLPGGYHLWDKVDVALAVGTHLQFPQMLWGVDDQLEIIKIDIDPEEHGRISQPAVKMVARSQDALKALLPELEKYNMVRPSRKVEMEALKDEIDRQLSSLEPQMSFIRAIREELPEDGFFVDEMTQVGYVSGMAMPVYQPGTYLYPGYQGTLGWGFPSALGVKVANPDRPVLSIAGDGGFMFSVQELATAVKHRIATVTVIFNNNAYGNVKLLQKTRYDNRVIASDLHNPDFVKLAEAFGVEGIRAQTPDELREALQKGFDSNNPTIIEVPMGEMPSPWPIFRPPQKRPARK